MKVIVHMKVILRQLGAVHKMGSLHRYISRVQVSFQIMANSLVKGKKDAGKGVELKSELS
jgi:hypothetical protein